MSVSLPQWPSFTKESLPTDSDQQYMLKAPVPSTTSATDQTRFAVTAKPLTVATYEVQDGDTLSGIAAKFSITTQSLVWGNDIANPNALKPGSSLNIPPTSGVLHAVQDGETLAEMANRYHVSVEEILGFKANGIANPDTLKTGQLVMVPGGVKPADPPVLRVATTNPAPAPARSAAPAAPAAPEIAPPAPTAGVLQWPTHGPIFTFFSGRHRGVDISPPYGTPVYAADAGTVVSVGNFGDGYGLIVLIDHSNGYRTMYAHLSAALVGQGGFVVRGQNIGRVGVSGIATGPHLHFEVYRNGVPVDPLGVLPR